MYKIEIWQYHCIMEVYENKDVGKALDWYQRHWRSTYDGGLCTFYLYKDEIELTFEEINKLGFFD